MVGLALVSDSCGQAGGQNLHLSPSHGHRMTASPGAETGSDTLRDRRAVGTVREARVASVQRRAELGDRGPSSFPWASGARDTNGNRRSEPPIAQVSYATSVLHCTDETPGAA